MINYVRFDRCAFPDHSHFNGYTLSCCHWLSRGMKCLVLIVSINLVCHIGEVFWVTRRPCFHSGTAQTDTRLVGYFSLRPPSPSWLSEITTKRANWIMYQTSNLDLFLYEFPKKSPSPTCTFLISEYRISFDSVYVFESLTPFSQFYCSK